MHDDENKRLCECLMFCSIIKHNEFELMLTRRAKAYSSSNSVV